ncbi:PLC-like phosphodiesterase [Pterulicium gracile]|uniref:Phosphoinositide phospholipase C n=1 Tax=Pterulicium gracile TaxID=1884261 RepID=A0A5C3Q8H1_9AGAR|nr:PLC-like phosphodiesterase [Pterula gracilis]
MTPPSTTSWTASSATTDPCPKPPTMSDPQERTQDVCEIRSNFHVDTKVNLTPAAYPRPRVSRDIEQFVQGLDLNVDDLLDRPTLKVNTVPDDQPLASYYISSSHNTYLLCRQLIGRASAAAYTHVLERGGRCVEIDVWPSNKGLVVTHGHTFSQAIPLDSVLSAIAEAVGPEDWPVFISLECHVPLAGQEELASMIKEKIGDKLVLGRNEDLGDNAATPKDFFGKILLMVEYFMPPSLLGEEVEEESSSSSSSSSDSEGASSIWPGRRKRKEPKPRISDSLAQLGFYCRSMKPKKGWFTENLVDPAHILINISESGLGALLPAALTDLVKHSNNYLRRVFPHGMRITSSNLNPITAAWSNGSQVAAMNWQVYDRGLELNEAMFVGSDGWVPKPAALGEPVTRKVRMKVDVKGVSAIPLLNRKGGTVDMYVRAYLFTTTNAGEKKWRSTNVKLKDVPEEGGDLSLEGDGESFEWEFEDIGLSFIRFNVWEAVFGRDNKLTVFCGKIEHIRNEISSDPAHNGWRFVRMLAEDHGGTYTGCTLLARFHFTDV